MDDSLAAEGVVAESLADATVAGGDAVAGACSDEEVGGCVCWLAAGDAVVLADLGVTGDERELPAAGGWGADGAGDATGGGEAALRTDRGW